MKQVSRSRRPKTRYKVKNWSEYNKALMNRGSITMWMAAGSEAAWYYQGPTQRGAQYTYSDQAIETALTLRQIFDLPFRQTQGFLQSVTALMKMKVSVPDYSVLCRRMKKLSVHIKPGKKITDLVFDGTGLKVYGEGEWKVKQHGACKRRTWRKLHIGLDPKSRQVQVMEVTSNAVHDADAAHQMLEQNKLPDLKRVYGDGAFDQWKLHLALDERNAKPVIPPRQGARIARHGNKAGKPLPRDAIIRLIRKYGRKPWKRRSGYHKRSLVENFFFRYKTIFGEHLKSRIMQNQKTEATINASILNQMLRIGAPQSYKVHSAS